MEQITIIERLVNELSNLPGLGYKSAEKIAYFLVESKNKGAAKSLADTLIAVMANTKICERCFNFSEGDQCLICSDSTRKNHICVVESPKDMLIIERTKAYRGLYHILRNEYYSDKDTLDHLLNRIKTEKPEEVIIATNTDERGNSLAFRITARLPSDIKITRLAQGMPSGSSVEFTTTETLAQAVINRKKL